MHGKDAPTEVRGVRTDDSAGGGMTAPVHHETDSDARANLKGLLDAAAAGRPATVRRESTRAAVVDAERLRGLCSGGAVRSHGRTGG
jgi:hypothetical protein